MMLPHDAIERFREKIKDLTPEDALEHTLDRFEKEFEAGYNMEITIEKLREEIHDLRQERIEAAVLFEEIAKQLRGKAG